MSGQYTGAGFIPDIVGFGVSYTSSNSTGSPLTSNNFDIGELNELIKLRRE
jgi:hypothetical protein